LPGTEVPGLHKAKTGAAPLRVNKRGYATTVPSLGARRTDDFVGGFGIRDFEIGAIPF